MMRGAGRTVVRFNGLFTTVSALNPVTSPIRTCIAGGVLRFTDVSSDDGVMEYSKNGGGFVAIAPNDQLAIDVGDTLRLRADLGSVGFQATATLRDNVGSAIIQGVQLERS